METRNKLLYNCWCISHMSFNVFVISFLIYLLIGNVSLPFSLFHMLETVRKSISEAHISSPHAHPPVPSEPSEVPNKRLSLKSQTCQDLGSHNSGTSHSVQLLSGHTVCHSWSCLNGDSNVWI